MYKKCPKNQKLLTETKVTNTSSMHRIVTNTRLLITGYWTMRTKKRQYRSSHFSGVVGVCSGTRERKMSLGGNDGTKHDITSSMRGSENHHPSSKSFTINTASTTICIYRYLFHVWQQELLFFPERKTMPEHLNPGRWRGGCMLKPHGFQHVGTRRG